MEDFPGYFVRCMFTYHLGLRPALLERIAASQDITRTWAYVENWSMGKKHSEYCHMFTYTRSISPNSTSPSSGEVARRFEGAFGSWERSTVGDFLLSSGE